MFRTNKNKAGVILFLSAFVIFGMAAYNPPKAPKTPKQGGYKNLQILPKDISKEDLDKVMHNFSESLGVKCGYCHVHTGEDFRSGWDMASDDKEEKGIARYMMKMTTSINTEHFNFDHSTMPDTIHVITCVTCHRGIPHPDAKGIMEQQQKMGTGNPPGMPPPPPPGTPPPPPNKN